MEIHEDFRDLLAEFANENVEFLVIGGYAVAHYDRPRYTKDIDLWINPVRTNIDAVCKALRAFGAPPRIIDALHHAREDEIVWLGSPPLRIDLLLESDLGRYRLHSLPSRCDARVAAACEELIFL